MKLRLSWNSPYIPGWPPTQKLPVSASQMLGMEVCATTWGHIFFPFQDGFQLDCDTLPLWITQVAMTKGTHHFTWNIHKFYGDQKADPNSLLEWEPSLASSKQ